MFYIENQDLWRSNEVLSLQYNHIIFHCTDLNDYISSGESLSKKEYVIQ